MRRLTPARCFLLALLVVFAPFLRAAELRTDQLLTDNWRTLLAPADAVGFEKPAFDDRDWSPVSVPHNHDTYHGYHQLRHGNLHGTAWYRTSFTIASSEQGRRIFLFFEGVGSYATVWVNGQQVGKHAGGLTTFTLDVTDAIAFGRENILAVRADHPAGIRDLPWLCGGCERTYGTSEGPQPLGIIRPVHVVSTAPVRIEPFGVHAWIDGPQSDSVATRIDTEAKNYNARTAQITLRTTLLDREGNSVVETSSAHTANPGETAKIAQTLPAVSNLHLWSPASPYLYTIRSEILINGQPVDRFETPFGFRWIAWPKSANSNRRRLLVNGEPFFINGTADYEHLLGNNFAFTDTQITARVRQIEAAGFNAFRDAHHPHNLRFQQYWDHDGLLWWTQFGDSTWFDNDAFRTNCKTLLTEWVKERRNSPSLILWGLQNESLLPTAFAEECSALIRKLDPTSSTQRLITTCNGGTGTDWDVPQNWSGTYSGDPEKYDEDLRTQSLIGEYGAWRSLGLHTEGGFVEKSPLSEDRFCALMEMKIALAEKARADACGHFQWPFVSHANPGRNFGELGEQLYDGIRPLDRVGPVNNKGLFTIWGEPTDAFYLYRANFAPKETQPMVYIVSHTWPDRWTSPGKKSGLIVYSNCDEVELFNGSRSLGRRTRAGIGTHFRWDDVEIDCNLLRAEARVGSAVVASDAVCLKHLPPPIDEKKESKKYSLVQPALGYQYLYRINCGGPAFRDPYENLWLADRDFNPGDSWGAVSWATEFANLPAAFASQGKTYSVVTGTRASTLFQTFRYGRENLSYRFAVPDGEYLVELFFVEPWYGIGDGLNCTGWRVFDVAINGQVVLRDFDLWREVGHGRAVKKTATARSDKGVLTISFPRVSSGQAVISAIAISTKIPQPEPNPPPPAIMLLKSPPQSSVETHLDTGDRHYSDVPGGFTELPYELFDADWLRTPASATTALEFKLSYDADVWVALDERILPLPGWLAGWERTSLSLRTNAAVGSKFVLYRKAFAKSSIVSLGEISSGVMRYTVFITRVLPPAPPQFVTLSDNAPNWQAVGNVKLGVRSELLGFSIVRFPDNLTGGDFILPSAAAPSPPLRLSADDHVEITGAFKPGTKVGGGWIDTKRTATANDGATFALWRQRLAAGASVEFASTNDTPLFAFVRAVRPSVTYKAQKVADNRTEWTIQVGVGDRYGLNFKYRNLSAARITATLEIMQANGDLLRTDPIEFPPTAEWAIVRTRTGASINAGTYKFRLLAPPQLQLENLEVE
ncbi:MAG: malectin domain-containing carbohydrate-binding protein [Nibricoccus sp.]